MQHSTQLSIRAEFSLGSFNYHMSCAEISLALATVCEQGRVLSQSELRCLELSLRDPLLKKMLELYPLPKKSQKIVTDSLEQQRARAQVAAAQVDTNVHSAIYGGVRERTARYLQQKYRSTGHENIIMKVEDFIKEMLDKKEAEKELTIAEAERYAIRETEYAAGRLSMLTPKQSFKKIRSDFAAYVEHLHSLHQGSSTYAWEPLSSLFLHLESLAKNSAQRDAAELLLLRALDDSRTAYHDNAYTYVAGKSYTCQKGLEERLLDHHALIVPAEKVAGGVDPLEKVILTLTEPFILRDREQRRLSCSQALHQLYLNAAGYRVEERRDKYFELSPAADREVLRGQYLATIGENRLERIRAGHEFDAFMRFFQDTPCHELERRYEHLVALFSQQDGLLTQVQKTQKHFMLPGLRRTSDDIMRRMVDQGPLIDLAHLEMVLALHDEKASLASMEQMALLDTPGSGAVFQQSAQEMRQAYQEYLATQRAPFYHFMNEQVLLLIRFGTPDFHTIGCSQTVLCQLLREPQSELPAAALKRLALLCAKSGYASAIKILFQRKDVSPNYVDEQERYSLLWIAANNGHTEAVKVLIEIGANVNLQDQYRENALFQPSYYGYTDIVRVLVNAGADVNLQSKPVGQTALMYAAKNSHSDILRALIEAGADVNLYDRYGHTALFEAAYRGYTDIVRVLVSARAFDHRLLFKQQLLFFIMIIWKLISLFEQTLQILGVRCASSNLGHIFARALQSGDIETVRTSIAAGANVNRLSDGLTALDVAIHGGNLTMVREVLVSERLAPWVIIKALKGCVENSEHHAEMLPLLLAHADAVQLIIRHGHQKAPLSWATEHQCLAAVQAFIKAGAPLNERNDNNETALMIAQSLGNEDLIALLSDRADQERRNNIFFGTINLGAVLN